MFLAKAGEKPMPLVDPLQSRRWSSAVRDVSLWLCSRRQGASLLKDRRAVFQIHVVLSELALLKALPRLSCTTYGGQQPQDKSCVITALTMPLGFCPHPPITFGLLQPLRPTCKLLIFPFTSARCTKKKKKNFSPFQI